MKKGIYVVGGEKLSNSAFLKAKEFIYRYGRKIDIAWFEYNFVNNSTDEFMKVLKNTNLKMAVLEDLLQSLNIVGHV